MIFRKMDPDGYRRLDYWEQWGQSAMLDWWQDAPTVLVGDFLNRGHAQLLFLAGDSGRVLSRDQREIRLRSTGRC